MDFIFVVCGKYYGIYLFCCFVYEVDGRVCEFVNVWLDLYGFYYDLEWKFVVNCGVCFKIFEIEKVIYLILCIY